MRESYNGIVALEELCGDYSDKKRGLLLEVLSNSDDIILNFINDQPTKFLALLDTHGKVEGTKWDDLVMKFEWTFELEKILNDSSIKEVFKSAIEDAGQKLKYNFNEAMVRDWMA